MLSKSQDDNSYNCMRKYCKIFTSNILGNNHKEIVKNTKPLNGSEKTMSDFTSWSGWIPSVISITDNANNYATFLHKCKNNIPAVYTVAMPNASAAKLEL